MLDLDGTKYVSTDIGGKYEDELRDFENINGGKAGDTLTGGQYANRLAGNSGSDKLSGGGAGDKLLGGLGSDTLTGGKAGDKSDEMKFVPGMPVDVFIRTRERTLVSYLLKPLTDQAARAFREK